MGVVPSSFQDDPVREQLLDEVIATYLDDVAGGQVPERLELLARYPHLATELKIHSDLFRPRVCREDSTRCLMSLFSRQPIHELRNPS